MNEYYHVVRTPHNPTDYFYAVYGFAEWAGWVRAVAITRHDLTTRPPQFNIGVDSFTMELLRERSPLKITRDEFITAYAEAIAHFNTNIGIKNFSVDFNNIKS